MAVRIRNQIIQSVLKEFCGRFVPNGRVLWVSEGRERVVAKRVELDRLGVTPLQARSCPNIVIHDPANERLFVIDVGDYKGIMTERRRLLLNRMFGKSQRKLLVVNAFKNRAEFQKLLNEFPWNTTVWFADEPAHLVHF